ncbi:MAG: Gfo/Idh/MocA family oxidoreductase [Acidobacteria bacterium]|nr:Gfo/Idh/MocA family oxidoreductase [Acidobacteriota bacterium]
MSQELSRRNFVGKAAALAAAPAVLPVLGANDQITLGVIGTGGRGRYLTERAFVGNKGKFTVSAVCDTYSGNLAKGKDVVASFGKNTPKAVIDYKEILADKTIDAVIIATPEHLHHRMLLDALAAGKHVYVEKPLAHTIEECQEIMKAVKTSKSVVQVGTQNRSNSLYQMAKTMISQGLIGDCHYVRAFWYRNQLPNGAAAWRYPMPDDATPQNTDWNRFLGSAPKKEFYKPRYFQWRLYWDYSSGIATDLMVHQTDITAFVMDQHIPNSVVATGGVYRWTQGDDREVPDTWSVLMDYESKFQINYSCYLGNERFGYGEQFMGNDGTIEVIKRQTLNFYPEAYPGVSDTIKARKELSITIPNNDHLAVEAHIRNFLNSVIGKEKPIAPPSAGYEAAIPGFMSVLSYRQGKKVLWDHKGDKYSFA